MVQSFSVFFCSVQFSFGLFFGPVNWTLKHYRQQASHSLDGNTSWPCSSSQFPSTRAHHEPTHLDPNLAPLLNGTESLPKPPHYSGAQSGHLAPPSAPSCSLPLPAGSPPIPPPWSGPPASHRRPLASPQGTPMYCLPGPRQPPACPSGTLGLAGVPQDFLGASREPKGWVIFPAWRARAGPP